MFPQIEDPLSVPDIMAETKWHPETEDFIKDLGRWVETEDDLPGMDQKKDKEGDATMEEDFNDLGDAFEDQGGGDEGKAAGAGFKDEGSSAADAMGFGGDGGGAAGFNGGNGGRAGVDDAFE